MHNSPLTHFDAYGLTDLPSFQTEQRGSWLSEGFSNPRFQGSLRAFGGLTEAGVGAGMTLYSGGGLGALGWPIMAHGLDNCFAGLKQAWTGNETNPATVELLKSVGVSSQAANQIDNGISMCGTIGGTAIIRMGQIAVSARLGFPANYAIPTKTIHEQILFGQKSVSSSFSEYGTFKGRPISEVVKDLKSGKISPDLVPIEIVIRNEQKITLNNRSLLALKRANIEPKVIIDRTGIVSDVNYESVLDSHLKGCLPTSTIRIRGGPSDASFIGPM